MSTLLKYKLSIAYIFSFLMMIGCKASFEVGGLSFNPLNMTIGVTGIKITPKGEQHFEVLGKGENIEAAMEDCYFNCKDKYKIVADTLVDLKLLKVERKFDISKKGLYKNTFYIKSTAVRYAEIYN